MVNLKVNDRVKFLGFKIPDPWSKLEVGTIGTVRMITNDGINVPVFVHWDSGSRLSHHYSEVEKIPPKINWVGLYRLGIEDTPTGNVYHAQIVKDPTILNAIGEYKVMMFSKNIDPTEIIQDIKKDMVNTIFKKILSKKEVKD